VNAVLQFSIADASKLEPTDEELRRFYAERPKLIAPQPLLTVKAVSLDKTQTKDIVALKTALDAGKGFDDAAKATAAKPVLLPGGPAIPSKIAEYAGATVRDAALALQKGESSGPYEIGRRVVFVHLLDRSEAPPPPLEAVRDVVLEEWRNRTTERAFEDYVASLRARARVSYSADAPKAN
jgi:parvulin-like peptidyl-prolyl isomerase